MTGKDKIGRNKEALMKLTACLLSPQKSKYGWHIIKRIE